LSAAAQAKDAKPRGPARKTYLIERFGDLPQAESNIHNPVDKMKTPVENYVLTEENFQKIDPMIGIREEDIKGIFK